METWRPTLDEATGFFQQERWQEALDKFLSIRDQLAPPGVDVHIFLCMKNLGRWEGMIPYLETTVAPPNDRNAELWRILGLLYLNFERDVEKAFGAWRRALALDPSLGSKYQGLQVVHMEESMLAAGMKPEIYFVDITTGNFSVGFR
jgi:tetratricopeptide (TPR) repeat protein